MLVHLTSALQISQESKIASDVHSWSSGQAWSELVQEYETLGERRITEASQDRERRAAFTQRDAF